ncbi:hypothetical protein C8A01DRAFT_18690 [Parachaetomium inaequale]|uniref:Uncharacterized protein n=1 Tax=Parachaetomium inaequale TaxID=2588326 RepID=A0AAN6PA25_9PEZI|nr:hypothetical protein C8A01DRAFT_18690 [Parachaetomium inaequale]
MAETYGPAGRDGQLHVGGQIHGPNGPDHSTLEVVPSHDYDRAAFGRNDKIAYVPSRENDKVVVEPPYEHVYPEQVHPGPYSPQTRLAQGGSAWDGDAWTTGMGGDPGTGKRERICGLKRRTFFIVLWVVSILVAIGVGVGTGVGVSLHSSNNSSGTEADATASGADMATRSTSSLPTTETSPATTSTIPSGAVTSTTRTSTFRSRSVSALPSDGAVQIGGPGGRCTSEHWGTDCICLDGNVCRNTWKGATYTGNSRDNYPCPNDPPAIVACIVKPCLGKSAPSQCIWREACAQVDNSKPSPFILLAPVLSASGFPDPYLDRLLTGSTRVATARCPGGDDFVCCDALL